MADQTLTGAEKTVTVNAEDVAAAKAENRKKVIKYVLIAVVLVALYFVLRKFVFKK
jgi:hypothetical protein